MHMEGKGEGKREYKREEMEGERGIGKSREKHYSNQESNLRTIHKN